MRIMRHPYRVDIQLFHQLNIFENPFIIHRPAMLRVMFVEINSFKFHRFSIDHELSVNDLNFAEAGLSFGYFKRFTGGIFQYQYNGI